jgi:hypothetical protein
MAVEKSTAIRRLRRGGARPTSGVENARICAQGKCQIQTFKLCWRDVFIHDCGITKLPGQMAEKDIESVEIPQVFPQFSPTPSGVSPILSTRLSTGLICVASKDF